MDQPYHLPCYAEARSRKQGSVKGCSPGFWMQAYEVEKKRGENLKLMIGIVVEELGSTLWFRLKARRVMYFIYSNNGNNTIH